jgi:catechol 2,3-dioxygenase-like lactoylglutathione lyase family enzyme
VAPFAIVKHLDVVEQDEFDSHHYAFKVSEAEFDAIFERLKAEGLAYGSAPGTPTDMTINHWGGGRGVYFRDLNGHLLELLTQDYTPELFGDD